MGKIANFIHLIPQRHPNILAVALGCLLVIVILAGIEGFLRTRLWWQNVPGKGPAKSNLYRIVERDSRLSFRGTPSSSLNEILTRGGETIYEAKYHLNAESQRRTCCPEPAAPTCTALFVGCSVTFGSGVSDDETLPSRFCKYQSRYQAINAGFIGYGLQQVWLQVTDSTLLDRLPSETGIIVYTFIDDHINRLLGTPAVLTGWNYPLPWLEAGEDGGIVYRGTFADRDPLQYFLYRYCGRLHLYRFLEYRLGGDRAITPATSSGIILAARIIEDTAEKIEEARSGFRLWVVLFPESTLGTALQQELDKTLVNILDCQNLLYGNTRPRDDFFYRDSASAEWGHPKALVYDLVARNMAENIPPCN